MLPPSSPDLDQSEMSMVARCPVSANHSTPGLAEVGVVVVVVDPVGEVEGVGLVALLVISAVGDGSHAAEGNSGEQGGDCEGLRKNI